MTYPCVGYSQIRVALSECVGYPQNCVGHSDSFWRVSDLKDVSLCRLSYILSMESSIFIALEAIVK